MSMRDTLSYVALEYGGCGYLLKNADLYNFEVPVVVEFQRVVNSWKPIPLNILPHRCFRSFCNDKF